MTKIDLDAQEVAEGLADLYEALWIHQEFWKQWLLVRTGFMADFFANEEEQAAAKALAEALSALADLAEEE